MCTFSRTTTTVAKVVANALEIRALLESKPVTVPDDVLRTYPRLKQIALPPREPGLFDAVP